MTCSGQEHHDPAPKPLSVGGRQTEVAPSGRTLTVSLVEAAIVVEARQGPDAARDLQLVVGSAIDEIVSVDEQSATAAIAAWRRFGKGRHPASLNFGDCFAYALSQVHGVPLLFKGNDFRQTDVEAVLPLT